jgi:hypothetical protein
VRVLAPRFVMRTGHVTVISDHRILAHPYSNLNSDPDTNPDLSPNPNPDPKLTLTLS